jgi:hypothetical protein
MYEHNYGNVPIQLKQCSNTINAMLQQNQSNNPTIADTPQLIMLCYSPLITLVQLKQNIRFRDLSSRM